jgi:methylase of polypeptide subunit release factors
VRILDLGSGSGVVAVEIARQTGLMVDCTDITPLIIANTRASALFAGLNHLIRVWKSDGLGSITGKYDFIVSNLPVPVNKDSEDAQRFDPHGRLLARVLEKLPDNLRTGGELLLMSRRDIAQYIPNNLQATIIHPFHHEDWPYAIHRIAVKENG